MSKLDDILAEVYPGEGRMGAAEARPLPVADALSILGAASPDAEDEVGGMGEGSDGDGPVVA